MSTTTYTRHPNFKLNDPSILSSEGWVDGKPYRAKSGKTFPMVDPATGAVWNDQSDLVEEDLEVAVVAAERAFKSWSTTPPRVRGRLIMEADRLLATQLKDIAQIMVLETGKTLAEATGEVQQCSSYSFVMAGEAERFNGETIKGADVGNASMRYFTTREPIGPVALMCPWNFPFVIPWRKAVAALAAGCTIVLKPSPEAACSAVAIGRIFTLAGLPDGVLNVIPTSLENTPKVGKAICEDERIKMIHFTGSTAVGKLLSAQSASTLKRLGLELGGNGAFIVFEDADLEKAATTLVANKYRNAGQVCVSANRVYVQKGVLDSFTTLMKAKVEELTLGHGMDTATTIGSMATTRGAERAVSLVEDAVKSGAVVIAGGKREGPGNHFQPTLLSGAGKGSSVHRTETFSPIVSIYAFDTEDEVVALANDSELGLTNYVFTRDISRAWRCFEALKSGQVAINNGSATSAEMPFGGVKHSGYGKEGGFKYALEDFCNVRTCALLL